MKRHIVIGLFLVAALTGSASAQPTWYVDWQAPGPPNDGLTWCTAFNDLDTALGIAMPGDFILVAQGTYVPANPLTGFTLTPGVVVLGGHGGCYGGFDARDIVNTPSILSGDLMLDDTPVSCTADSPDCDGLGGRCLHGLCVLPANNIENTCHVVSALGLGATAAFLDGFTITGGNADPMSIHVCTEQDGGGMLIQNSSVAVYDCIFEWNVAAGGGGGMYSYQSDPTVDGCTFERNSADFGGGMYNEEGTPGVHGSTFLRNAALTDGGGMYNDSASPDVGFCDFIENDAGQHGGGMDNYGSSPTVYNCTFSNNVAASYAAGMYNYYGSSPAITNCAFTGNVAGGLGGGMCNYLSSSPTVSNSIFTGNYGWNGGGMLNAGTSSPTLVNCTFTGNSAYTGAGGINGGGESCSATLTNCILWGDTPAEIQDGVSTTVAYSDVQGGLPTDIIDGGGNIDADPLFVDADGADDVFGTIDDDVHLQSGSPCVNTGDPNDAAYSGELDIDLQPRVQQCRVDMGADETPYLLDDCNANGLDDVECDIGGGTSTDCNGNSVPDDCETLPSGTIYVDDSATGGLNDGSSWDNAFVQLSAGRDFAACTGTVTEIRVGQGTYKPTTDTDRTATFELISGVSILGGYAGHGAGDPDERNIELYETILSGDLAGDDDPPASGGSSTCCTEHFYSGCDDATCQADVCAANFWCCDAAYYWDWQCAHDAASLCCDLCAENTNTCENSFHVVIGSGTDDTAVLDGFTVTGGNANSLSAPHDRGGGMYNESGSPTVTNCTFTGNTGLFGGGMHNESGSPTVTNCTFSGNSADYGGGMYNYSSSLTVTNCTFSGNSGTHGGGMFNWDSSSLTVTNCTFSGNSGTYGGGMSNWESSNPTVINCIFTGNTSPFGGGMYNSWESSPTVTNCTFSGNSADYDGGGMYNEWSSNPTVTNCIFWGNTGGEIFNSSSTAVVTYSDVQGGTGRPWFGTGCIDIDPMLDADGVHLLEGSPCVNTGDPNDAAYSGELDIDLQPRVQQCRVDMGADETTYYLDCNSNSVADECDLDNCAGQAWCDDCNGNGILDECDIADCAGDPACEDCNDNGIPDSCDIVGPTSADCQANGVPDECELTDNDCNANGFPDECEIDAGSAAAGGPFFCNPTAPPEGLDECDLDCNNTGIPDECELTDNDCNSDGRPDECGVMDDCLFDLMTFPAPLNTNAASDNSGWDFHPQLTTDGQGNWLAVWYSIGDLGGTIGTDRDILFSASTDNGANWTPVAPLNTNAGFDIGGDYRPQLTTDGQGNWLAVWYSQDDLGGTIGTDMDLLFSASTDNGAGWSDPAPLNINAASDSGGDWLPQITTDGRGNWLAVWGSRDDLGGTIGTDGDILFSHSTDNGASWSAPAPVNTNAASDSGWDDWPQLTTDGQGNWLAVWESYDDLGGTIGGDHDILFSHSTDNGASWTPVAPLNTNAASDSGEDGYAQLTTDGQGNWLAVWESTDDLGGTIGTDPDILFSRSTDNGASWSSPTPLNTNAASDSGEDECPQLTTDEEGNWLAVWESQNDLGGTIGPDSDILFSQFRSIGEDCNCNGTPDACDIAGGAPDDNANGIPDECEMVSPELPADPRHQARKHRYLSLDPSSNASEVAYKVELVEMMRCSGDLRRTCSVDADCPNVCDNDSDITCTGDPACMGGTCVASTPCIHHPDEGLSWWVQAPEQEPLGCRLPGGCTDQDWFARLDTTLHSQTWNDFGVADSSLLHISDCQITPVATYAVSACMPPDGDVCSDPLVIGTILRPPPGNYGDVVGPVDPVTTEFDPPNQILSVGDISGYLLTNLNYGLPGDPKPQAHWTWVDMEGQGTPFYRPQAILNVGDLNQILFGLMGRPYSWAGNNVDPGDCP